MNIQQATTNHEQVYSQLSHYRALSPEERLAVDNHLATCDTCATRLRQIEAMDAGLSRLVEQQVSYAATHFPTVAAQRRTILSKAMKRPRAAWVDHLLYRLSPSPMLVRQTAGALILFVVVLALAMVLAGPKMARLMETTIGADATTPAAVTNPTAPVTLRFACNYDPQCSHYRRLAEEFQQLHPDISIKMVERSEPSSDFAADERKIAAETDVVESYLFGYSTFLQLIGENAINLAPLLQEDNDLRIDQFYPVLKPYLQGETVLVLPRQVMPITLLYNRAVFTQEGIALPMPDWTVKEMFALAQRLTLRNGDSVQRYGVDLPDFFLFRPSTLVLAQMENIRFDEETGNLTGDLTTGSLLPSLRRYLDLIQNKAIRPNWSDKETPAALGLAPVTLYGNVPPIDLKKLGLIALPKSVNVHTPPIVGPFYYISTHSLHPTQSWLWVKFLLQNTKVQGTSLPALRPVAENPTAWAETDWSSEEATLLRSLVERPVVAMELREDTAFESVGNAVNIIDEVIRNTVKYPGASDNLLTWSLKPAIESWQAGQAKLLATQTAPLSSTQGITLTFGCTDILCPEYQQLADSFNRQYPGIYVEVLDFQQLAVGMRVQNSDEIRAKLTEAVDTTMVSFGFDQTFATQYFANLQPLIDQDPDFDAADFLPFALKMYHWENGTWLLPSSVSPFGIIYDKDAFDQAGIPYPQIGWTRQEFLDAARKLTQRNGAEITRYGFIDTINDGLSFEIDQFRAVLLAGQLPTSNQTEISAAIRWYTDLALKEGVMPNPQRITVANANLDNYYSQAQEWVRAGKAAMWTGDVTALHSWQDSYERLGIAPTPNNNGMVIPGTAPVFAINAKTRHPQESWLWLKWLSKHKISGTLGMDGKRVEVQSVPARTSIAQSSSYWERWTADEQTVIQHILTNLPAVPQESLDSFVLVAQLRQAFQEVFAGSSVEEALKNAAETLTKEAGTLGDCLDPDNAITQPQDGAKLNGTVVIQGKVAMPKIAFYELAYRTITQTDQEFQRFDGGFKPVAMVSTLGRFKTETLPAGNYVLRLRVVDQNGMDAATCQVKIVIEK